MITGFISILITLGLIGVGLWVLLMGMQILTVILVAIAAFFAWLWSKVTGR
jgi:hypothetical protein